MNLFPSTAHVLTFLLYLRPTRRLRPMAKNTRRCSGCGTSWRRSLKWTSGATKSSSSKCRPCPMHSARPLLAHWRVSQLADTDQLFPSHARRLGHQAEVQLKRELERLRKTMVNDNKRQQRQAVENLRKVRARTSLSVSLTTFASRFFLPPLHSAPFPDPFPFTPYHPPPPLPLAGPGHAAQAAHPGGQNGAFRTKGPRV